MSMLKPNILTVVVVLNNCMLLVFNNFNHLASLYIYHNIYIILEFSFQGFMNKGYVGFCCKCGCL